MVSSSQAAPLILNGHLQTNRQDGIYGDFHGNRATVCLPVRTPALPGTGTAIWTLAIFGFSGKEE